MRKKSRTKKKKFAGDYQQGVPAKWGTRGKRGKTCGPDRKRGKNSVQSGFFNSGGEFLEKKGAANGRWENTGEDMCGSKGETQGKRGE